MYTARKLRNEERKKFFLKIKWINHFIYACDDFFREISYYAVLCCSLLRHNTNRHTQHHCDDLKCGRKRNADDDHEVWEEPGRKREGRPDDDDDVELMLLCYMLLYCRLAKQFDELML